MQNHSLIKPKQTRTGPSRRHIQDSKIVKGLQRVKAFSSTAPEKLFEKSLTMPKKNERGTFWSRPVLYLTRETFLVQIPGPIGAIYVTSTSQHQIFDEKFDQEPENVRIKMADLAGP